jgi:hypothetical protein
MSAQPHGRSHGLDNPEVAHEHHDVNVRAILWFVGVLTAITVGIQVAMWGMLHGLQWYERRNEPYVTPLARPAGQPFPEPTLQTTPWTDLQKFRSEQHQYLHSYGWVDEKLGVARIPISKAKQLLLERGVPVRPELASDLDGTNIAATGDSSGGRSLPAGGADKTRPAGGGFVSPDAVASPSAPAATPSTPKKPGGGL